jgi:uncharacterized protein (DUF362 family)
MSSKIGKVIRSRDLAQEFIAKEMSRRNFVRRAAMASAGGAAMAALPGCPPVTDDDDDSSVEEDVSSLVGMGSADDYLDALDNALAQTVGKDGLSNVISSGDTVYLKVNCNSGDLFPFSSNQSMVERIGQWAWDLGATRVIVGDRSFWGDPGTLGNMTSNGMVAAAENIGAELVVFNENDGDIEWVEVDHAEDVWNGALRFPRVVVEADVIINLPCIKTHFISGFTMALKNLIGLVHADDRERTGNLDYHADIHNKIALLNQHITPTLNILDGWEAVTRGGPTPDYPVTAELTDIRTITVSTDRIAVDAVGLALLKKHAHSTEEVHDNDVWENPQIEAAVDAGVGITGPEEFDAAGPTVEDFDEIIGMITG